MSIRRAWRAFVVHGSVLTYRSAKPDDAPVGRRLHELAKDRTAFNVRRLHAMLPCDPEVARSFSEADREDDDTLRPLTS